MGTRSKEQERKVTYQLCTRCVLDTSIEDIKFDSDGVCQYCREYDERKAYYKRYSTAEVLEKAIADAKEKGRGKKYDAVIGLSGGVDSSYTALLAVKKYGLRLTATHLDNGLDDPKALKNVEALVKHLGIGYEPVYANLPEYRKIVRAYYLSGVFGLENPADHAIVAVCYQMAQKYNVEYMLSGHNWATESHLPRAWAFDAMDIVNIIDICRRFGAADAIKTMPQITQSQLIHLSLKLKIKELRLLNYLWDGDNFAYIKNKVKEELKKEIGWQDYGPKHWENVYTRFLQIYMLPTRYGRDKRRSHLSGLIASGQMTRDAALGEMANPISPELIEHDKSLVMKELGFTPEEFGKVVSVQTTPRRRHEDFKIQSGGKGKLFAARALRAVRPYLPKWIAERLSVGQQ